MIIKNNNTQEPNTLSKMGLIKTEILTPQRVGEILAEQEPSKNKPSQAQEQKGLICRDCYKQLSQEVKKW